MNGNLLRINEESLAGRLMVNDRVLSVLPIKRQRVSMLRNSCGAKSVSQGNFFFFPPAGC